jgi:predicted phage terminase large subunit-like protein
MTTAIELAQLPVNQRLELISELTNDQAEDLLYDWSIWARDKQLTPPGDWRIWLILAGRGWGKSRVGAEDVKAYGLKNPKSRIAIVAPTFADARDVCVEGDSGLLNILPPRYIKTWNRSIGELILTNGTQYKLYSADEPSRLRGPQNHRAWCDELAVWNYPEAFDMLMFGLRLGDDPRCVITTTPKPTELVKNLVKRAGADVHLTRGTTYENKLNLAESFMTTIIARFEGSRLGRQELMAELLEDTPGALWNTLMLEHCRVTEFPDLQRVVIGVDPAISNNEGSAETGIIAAGIDENRTPYVLEDASLQGSPHEWASAVIAVYNKLKADRVVVEVNNGGDMCESVIRMTKGGERIPITKVHASRGKYTRAEPIAALYEQGRAHHVGFFPELEGQMTTYVPGDTSPDRMDALVWAMTELTDGGSLGDMDENIRDLLMNFKGY